MDAQQLRYVTGWLLPAGVTIPGDAMANGSSPHRPSAGPFRVPLAHACQPRPGICGTCGRNGGDLEFKRRQLEIDADHLVNRK